MTVEPAHCTSAVARRSLSIQQSSRSSASVAANRAHQPQERAGGKLARTVQFRHVLKLYKYCSKYGCTYSCIHIFTHSHLLLQRLLYIHTSVYRLLLLLLALRVSCQIPCSTVVPGTGSDSSLE